MNCYCYIIHTTMETKTYSKAISLIICKGKAIQAASCWHRCVTTLRDETDTAGVHVSCTGCVVQHICFDFRGPAEAGPVRSAMTDVIQVPTYS